MKQLLALTLCVSVALFPSKVCAEGFLGIGAKSRLQDVKGLFPNARFSDLKPVWLKSHQRLIDIAGAGIDGAVAVRLEHEVEGTRLLAKELALRQAQGTLEDWQVMVLEGMPSRLERLQSNPPVDPWEVKDIRWQPPTPIPLQTASRRYGAPSSDKTDEQFRRVVEWDERGITGYLNSADSIDLFIFSFTVRDYICADPTTAPPGCKEQPRSTDGAAPARKK